MLDEQSRRRQWMGGRSPFPNSLVLDANQRLLYGVDMLPLLTGELALLEFLGSRPRVWHSARALSVRVYRREDPAALQLVWKYVSTLRKKLRPSLPGLIAACRLRGYSCGAEIQLITDADPVGFDRGHTNDLAG